MKVYSGKVKLKEIGTIALGILASLVFIKIIPLFLVVGAPYTIKLILFFLYGVFVVNALGMILKEDSRIGGLLIVSISTPMLYHFVLRGYIYPKYILIGVIIGFLVDVYSFLRNRYDILAKITKIFLSCFFLIYVLYLIYIFLLLPYLGSNLSSYILYRFFAGFGLTTFMFVLLMKTIRGIKASEMFVFGGTNVGKTYLMLALYNDIIHFYKGSHNEIILSPSQEKAEEIRIGNMLALIEEGHKPRSNLRNEVAMYSLEGKKRGIIPMRLTVVDYGGEVISEISKEKYLEVVEKLSYKMNANEYEIEERIGDIKFLEYIKKNEHVEDIFEDVVLAYLYKCLENSGKIVFLIDGELVQDLIQEGRKKELITLFDFYKRLIDLLGHNKKYSFVVTKTDLFEDIKDIEEDSKEAEEIESSVYKHLESIITFKELVNKINTSFYFYSVSVDFTKDKENNVLRINPWRVKEIVRFGFDL